MNNSKKILFNVKKKIKNEYKYLTSNEIGTDFKEEKEDKIKNIEEKTGSPEREVLKFKRLF